MGRRTRKERTSRALYARLYRSRQREPQRHVRQILQPLLQTYPRSVSRHYDHYLPADERPALVDRRLRHERSPFLQLPQLVLRQHRLLRQVPARKGPQNLCRRIRLQHGRRFGQHGRRTERRSVHDGHGTQFGSGDDDLLRPADGEYQMPHGRQPDSGTERRRHRQEFLLGRAHVHRQPSGRESGHRHAIGCASRQDHSGRRHRSGNLPNGGGVLQYPHFGRR